MHIGIDLDGVIVNSICHWIEILNREAGTNFAPHDLPDTHGTPEMAALSDRFELEMTISPGPVAGAAEAVRRLQQEGNRLVVVTARPPRLQELTRAWLQYHGMQVDNLHFLEGGSKVPVARSEGLDLIVEDTPRNALALAEAEVPVLLFDALYNRDVDHPLIVRCNGWQEVLHQVTGRSKRPVG